MIKGLRGILVVTVVYLLDIITFKLKDEGMLFLMVNLPIFKRTEFNPTEARTALKHLESEFQFTPGMSLADFNATINNIQDRVQIYGSAPLYVLTRAIYTQEDGDENSPVIRARFTLKPSKANLLYTSDMHHEFAIEADENIFSSFISELAYWFDKYEYYARCQVNLDYLNAVVQEVIVNEEIPYSLQFSMGETLPEFSDTHAVIGVPDHIVEAIETLPLFDTDIEYRKEGYTSIIAQTLKEVVRPYELVKVKSKFTRDLGIYSRRSIQKLMRKKVTRKLAFTRTGTGYYNEDGVFAIVTCVAVTPDELEALDTTAVQIQDNTSPNVSEKNAGKTKIVSYFVISPFSVETGASVDMNIQDLKFKKDSDAVAS